MQDLNDLYYYVQAVDHGGFARAGGPLSMRKRSSTRRNAKREERLGVRLIQRSTRHFAVTDAGEAYYTHCKAMLVEAERAQEAIDTLTAEPRGVIRMTCPIPLVNTYVGAMLAGFMLRYPHVTVQMEATNRRVDLVSESVDVALRVRHPPLQDSDLVMRILADRSQCLVASPILVQKLGFPATPAALSNWPSLGLGILQQIHAWALLGPDGTNVTLHHTPRFVTTDMVALRDAAVAGVGVVELPVIAVRDQLTAGLLVKLLPDWTPRRIIIHAVFPSRRGLLPSVRALIDFLTQRFEMLHED